MDKEEGVDNAHPGRVCAPAAGLYVEPPADAELERALANHDGVVLVQGSRHAGKSSLRGTLAGTSSADELTGVLRGELCNSALARHDPLAQAALSADASHACSIRNPRYGERFGGRLT